MGRKTVYLNDDPYMGREAISYAAKPTKEEVTIKDDKTPTFDRPVYDTGAKNTYNYTPYTGGFKPSQAYTDAMALTNSMLDRINSGKTSYSDKLDAIMGKIENRPAFNYDFNADPLFQNALASAMASGQTAMQDTIGQTSALTGGYGSSYATSAANQAYNNMVKEAYSELPQYYNIARDAYDREGEDLYNQLGMYRAADESEYSRLNNAYNLNYNNAESIYNKEYSNYWDTANYNRQVAESNANLKYKYDALEREQARYDAEAKRADDQFKEEMAYKYAALDGKSSKKGSSEYTEPTTTQMDKALKAYETGGDAEVEKLLASLPDDTDVAKIYDYVHSYGKLPYSQREYKSYKDTKNWGGGLDNNDIVKDPYDDTQYKLIDLAKLIAEQENIPLADAKKLVEKYNGRK